MATKDIFVGVILTINHTRCIMKTINKEKRGLLRGNSVFQFGVIV